MLPLAEEELLEDSKPSTSAQPAGHSKQGAAAPVTQVFAVALMGKVKYSNRTMQFRGSLVKINHYSRPVQSTAEVQRFFGMYPSYADDSKFDATGMSAEWNKRVLDSCMGQPL